MSFEGLFQILKCLNNRKVKKILNIFFILILKNHLLEKNWDCKKTLFCLKTGKFRSISRVLLSIKHKKLLENKYIYDNS